MLFQRSPFSRLSLLPSLSLLTRPKKFSQSFDEQSWATRSDLPSLNRLKNISCNTAVPRFERAMCRPLKPLSLACSSFACWSVQSAWSLLIWRHVIKAHKNFVHSVSWPAWEKNLAGMRKVIKPTIWSFTFWRKQRCWVRYDAPVRLLSICICLRDWPCRKIRILAIICVDLRITLGILFYGCIDAKRRLHWIQGSEKNTAEKAASVAVRFFHFLGFCILLRFVKFACGNWIRNRL